MNWPGQTTCSPIGIDIGHAWIHAAQLRRQRGQWSICAAVALPRREQTTHPNEQEVQRLLGVLRRQGFVGNELALTLPASMMLSHVFEMPGKSATVPLEQVSRMELSRAYRCEPSRLELSCWPVPASSTGGSKTLVFAEACRHDDAETLLKLFEQHGSEVVHLSTATAGLIRAAQPWLAAQAGISSMVDIGWGACRIMLLNRGTLFYQRDFEEGGIGALHSVLKQHTGLKDEPAAYLVNRQLDVHTEQQGDQRQKACAELNETITAHREHLVRELTLSLQYVRHRYPEDSLRQIILTGGGAALPRLETSVHEATGVQAQIAQPVNLLACREDVYATCGSPALMQAIGSAMVAAETPQGVSMGA